MKTFAARIIESRDQENSSMLADAIADITNNQPHYDVMLALLSVLSHGMLQLSHETQPAAVAGVVELLLISLNGCGVVEYDEGDEEDYDGDEGEGDEGEGGEPATLVN